MLRGPGRPVMTVTAEQTEPPDRAVEHADGVTLIDPRAPRFGQTLTALGLGTAVLIDLPILLYATAAVLLVAVISGWRIDLYAALWGRVGIPIVGQPTEREPAAPHRFARVLGAIGAGLASALVFAGVTPAGSIVAALVALLAFLAASTGFCLGCRMYRHVARFRRLDVV